MNAFIRSTSLSLLALGLLAACERSDLQGSVRQADPAVMPPQNMPPVNVDPGVIDDGREEPQPFDPVPIDMEPGMEVGVTPMPSAPPPAVRSRRRMDIDQLDASLRRVTGGIGWTEPLGGGREENQLVVLAGTLGKPDYIETTREDLEPSAMFLKFLNDGARSACDKLLAREVAAVPSSRTFLLHVSPTDDWATAPDMIEANLRELLLNFHGRATETIGPEIEQWKWLYRSAEHIAEDPVIAWRTVCVALITHPDFYTY